MELGEMLFGSVTAGVNAADIIAYANIPLITKDGERQTKPVPIATINTISWSTQRDKVEVRRLGECTSAGMTGGPRTVAGSLVFSTIYRNEFTDIVFKLRSTLLDGKNGYILPEILYPDELPPLDITILGMTEGGVSGTMKISGLSIMGGSSVMSIHQILTDTSYVFKARAISPLESMTAIANKRTFNTTKAVVKPDEGSIGYNSTTPFNYIAGNTSPGNPTDWTAAS